ncbi:histidine phosphatase family protein [Roseimaritima multifibrata]|uniref:histidine phosphatase family protein n=1 Tax=Roseimaritima multifibrata TaxID=1930274 RepID=UPI001FE2898C|nr:histidine phosphatase family protein [Roseimaritima multifibrata]
MLVRPGATEFDQQGRIKGSLDMPLCDHGREQANHAAKDLQEVDFEAVYTAPCESAIETAKLLIGGRKIKNKVIEGLRNVDHGLWHGKLIDEVRRQQPRVYKKGQDSPGDLCPPGGETMESAKERVQRALQKIIRKHRKGSVALVIPDPLASIVRSLLSGKEMRDLWKSETDAGTWECLELCEPATKPQFLFV